MAFSLKIKAVKQWKLYYRGASPPIEELTLSCWEEVPSALADLQAQLIEGRLALTQG